MNRTIFYIAALIGIFLVIVYYKGSTAFVSTSGSALQNLIMTLQGRNPKNGGVANYPQ